MNGTLGPCPLQLVNILTYAAPNDDPFLVANLPHPVGQRDGLGTSPIPIAIDQHLGDTPDVDIIEHSARLNPSITEAGRCLVAAET